MKTLTVFSFLLLCLVSGYAQDLDTGLKKIPQKECNSLQLHLGSAGAGLDYRRGITSRFAARAGFTGIPELNFNSNGSKYDNVVKGSMINGHILLDYIPFRHFSKKLKIVAGVGYFNITGTVKRSTKDGQYNYGDIPLSKDDVGFVTANTAYKGFAPYAGLAAFNLFGRKKISMNFDFGTYYLPAPKTSLVGTNMLSGMDKENDQLQENLKGYRWLPLLQLNLIYKL